MAWEGDLMAGDMIVANPKFASDGAFDLFEGFDADNSSFTDEAWSCTFGTVLDKLLFKTKHHGTIEIIRILGHIKESSEMKVGYATCRRIVKVAP